MKYKLLGAFIALLLYNVNIFLGQGFAALDVYENAFIYRYGTGTRVMEDTERTFFIVKKM